jgi:cytochrome c peroxidase
MASMKADYKRSGPRSVENAALVGLGRSLFYDPRVSASGTTACAGCHFSNLGRATTDAKSRNDSGKLTSRRSQTLLALGYVSGPIGWDGRSATLEAQAKSSIATGSMSMSQTDAPVKVEVIEERIRAIPDYAAKFNAALPGAAIDVDAIAKAIAAYERTIEPGIAPFDRWIEGDESAISESAKRGFVLFNGKAECSLCHSGWRFTNDTFHDIGVSTKDLGRGREVKDDPLMQYALGCPAGALYARRLGGRSPCGGEALREGRHRPPEPLASDQAHRPDRPAAHRPRRLHGDADRRGRGRASAEAAVSRAYGVRPGVSDTSRSAPPGSGAGP